MIIYIDLEGGDRIPIVVREIAGELCLVDGAQRLIALDKGKPYGSYE